VAYLSVLTNDSKLFILTPYGIHFEVVDISQLYPSSYFSTAYFLDLCIEKAYDGK